ncbi:type II toxin-antitoxin system Phd/YefM family antitoxin [Sphingomonas canadensis]|uniref:Antitoxin n=1 Tax=Sphingomonas canadensis TaxID=1219257 RepID=A0ABW3H3V3_9SPHN|nr:type II toxin-antitoxin system Phd/YefM family antitoxin [Sphingomonas canadensis]MCW3835891.1 type II toxin-antitoxin system Phd/YefM family antitoxin [Sphingomonas canadensis]
MKSVTSREFNQDVSAAKRFALAGPVLVTDRGRPTHVLMSIEAFHQLAGSGESIVDLLAMSAPGEPGGAHDADAAWERAAEL